MKHERDIYDFDFLTLGEEAGGINATVATLFLSQ